MEAKKILIIEDEPALLKAIKAKLELNNFEVSAVTTVDEAHDALKTKKPDLIWLDHYLPRKNGLEFFAEIKHREETKDIPVFLVSNSADVSDLYSYINMGVDKYYVKMNSSLDEIIDDIEEYLERK